MTTQPMRKMRSAKQGAMVYQFLTRYHDVMRFPYQDRATIRDYQFRRIKHLLHIAYHHTHFYRWKYKAVGLHPDDIQSWKDFQQVPTVSKGELREYVLDFVDNRLDPRQLILSRSSGSSGQFVDVYMSEQAFITQAVQVIRMLKEFYPDYQPTDTEMMVYTSEFPVLSIGGMYQVAYVNNLQPAEEIFQEIVRERPVIVAIYPSILREIVHKFGEQCGDLGIQAIVTNSEQSSQAERDEFARIFNCAVFDEYSSEEVPGIAQQCVAKHYHPVEDMAYIEILDQRHDEPVPVGQVGEIVGTNLLNMPMPLIRYRQGDLAVWSDETCTCGKSAPLFKELYGRMNSSFRRPDTDEIIPSGRILDWTYTLVLGHEMDISEFQVTQTTPTEIEVAVVPGYGYSYRHDNEMIARSFRETFGDVFDIGVKLVHHIPKTKAGKHIPIRSLVE